MTVYIEKLAALQAQNQSTIGLRLNPIPDMLPLEVVTRWDEPLLPYNKALINATKDVVCAYQLSLAHYLNWGAAGIIALERTLGYMPADVPVILDCRMAITGDGLAGLLEGAFVWGADAVVLSEEAILEDGLSQMAAYATKHFYLLGHGAQGFKREALVSAENIGYALHKPQWRSVAGLRAAAPSAHFLLMDSVGDVPPLCDYGKGGGAEAVLSFGRKLLYASAGRDWAEACREAVIRLRDTINEQNALANVAP